jgi:hypothetical protein
MVEGQFPTRALGPVLEWYRLHRAELTEDWRLASERKPLKGIEPRWTQLRGEIRFAVLPEIFGFSSFFAHRRMMNSESFRFAQG